MSSACDLGSELGSRLARNMRRFYRIDILPDFFGSVLIMKQWERIGSTRQCQVLRFEDAATAHAAPVGG
jgi:predicted DNA-binding WGR domain protein